MVTASHNAFEFNGVKFKTASGCSASEEVTKKIENYITKSKIKYIDITTAKKKGLIKIIDILPGYERNIRKFIDWAEFKKRGLKVLVDTMHGAADGLFLNILKGTRVKISTLHGKALANFGGVQPEPIKSNLKELINLMKNGDFDLGLATDGDGDRLSAITPEGKFINSSRIFGLLINYIFSYGKEKGAIAKTVSCSTLIDKIAENYNLPLKETPIGFKHLSSLMLKENIVIAGEESGGIGLKKYLPERDGIFVGLLLIEMLAKTKKSITRLLNDMDKRFGKFFYERKDIKVPLAEKDILISKIKNFSSLGSIINKKVKKINKIDGIKIILEDDSWLMYRFSGTEPILRIYIESDSKSKTLKLMNFALKYVNQL